MSVGLVAVSVVEVQIELLDVGGRGRSDWWGVGCEMRLVILWWCFLAVGNRSR